MNILNFGSLNLDFVYAVDHFVAPGETLASRSLTINCGGKGLNQSIALAKAGANVFHAGKVGSDGAVLTALLSENGVSVRHVFESEQRSGNAIIQVNRQGQNSILLYGGANQDIDCAMIDAVLRDFKPGDFLLLQNEINNLAYIMEKAHQAGLIIAFNPSPADASIASLPLQYVSVFLLNEIEGEMLTRQHNPEAILRAMQSLYPDSRIVLTLGEKGVCYADTQQTCSHDIFPVPVVDTTAAGDTFTGYFLAGLMNSHPIPEILKTASKASAIAVTRAGAAASIPTRTEVEQYKE